MKVITKKIRFENLSEKGWSKNKYYYDNNGKEELLVENIRQEASWGELMHFFNGTLYFYGKEMLHVIVQGKTIIIGTKERLLQYKNSIYGYKFPIDWDVEEI